MKSSRVPVLLFFCFAFPTLAAAQRYYSFPHFASGGGWSSDIYLTNQGSQAASDVLLSFFDDNGTPLTVPTNLGTSTVFSLNLAAGETKAIQTISSGSFISGHALVRFPVSASVRGSEIFGFAEGGITTTQVGVPLQSPFQHFSLPVDIKISSNSNTGVALANPVIGASQNQEQTVVLNLIRTDGTLHQTTVVKLAAGQHTAKFLHELFPGLDNFSGALSISAPGSIGVLGLRQSGNLYGSVSVSAGPVLAPFVQTGASTPETEPNDGRTQATAMTKSGIFTGTISSPSDVDYYSFTGKRGDIVSFLLDAVSTNSYLDSLLRLEQSDGTLVSENDQNGLLGQNDSFLQVALPADGTYYLHVGDYWGDGGSTYTYRLHAGLASSQPGLPAPQITSLSPSSGRQGETISLTITGTNLSGATAVDFTPNSGIAVTGIQSATTQVTCSILINQSATTGTRTVTVTNAGGTSNALTFTVNQATTAAPSISQISPPSGKQGATVSLIISGTNLSGATAVNFSSSSGIAVSGIQSTATQVTCSVTISASATTGSRSVTVTTAAGTSDSLTFSVTSSATGTAPTISNLSAWPVVVSTSPKILIQISGSFDFTDPDGDIVYTGVDATSAKMRFTMTLGSSCTITSTGAYLNKPGVTSGHVELLTATFEAGSMNLGTFYVTFRLLDAAGNASNSLSFNPGLWYCDLFPRDTPNRAGDRYLFPISPVDRQRCPSGVNLQRRA